MPAGRGTGTFDRADRAPDRSETHNASLPALKTAWACTKCLKQSCAMFRRPQASRCATKSSIAIMGDSIVT